MTKKELESPKNKIESEQASETKQNTSNHSTLLWCAIGVMFIVVCLFGSTAFWFYQQHYQPLLQTVQNQQSVSSELALVASHQQQQDLKLSQQQQSHRQIIASVEELQGALSVQEVQLSSLNTDLANMNGTRASDWLIAEADYLTRMAGRKIWLEDDTQTAILLLKEADLRLEEVGDPALIPARKAIASDVLSIKQASNNNTLSIALTLNSIIEQIDTLPLNSVSLPVKEYSENKQVTNNVEDWKDNLLSVFDSLADDLFRYEKLGSDIQPFLTHEQQYIVKERLRLALLQAQNYIIQRRISEYKVSLNVAISLIEQHFAVETPRIVEIIKILNTEKQKNIESSSPTELASTKIMKNITSNRIQKGDASNVDLDGEY
jgi:uroporphyrin-3 C-methyltransferase